VLDMKLRSEQNIGASCGTGRSSWNVLVKKTWANEVLHMLNVRIKILEGVHGGREMPASQHFQWKFQDSTFEWLRLPRCKSHVRSGCQVNVLSKTASLGLEK
jgi:hypothetical protein